MDGTLFPLDSERTAEASTNSASGLTRYRATEPSADFLSSRRSDLALASSFSESFDFPVWTAIIAREQEEITSLVPLRIFSLLSSWSENRASIAFTDSLTSSMPDGGRRARRRDKSTLDVSPSLYQVSFHRSYGS